MAAIKGLNLPPGSEIITTPYTFSASAASILYMGHTPVFADVTSRDYTLDPDSIGKVITAKTAALMPVDLFGGLADYGRLKQFAYPIIQDACQAVGASKKWLYGDVATWSFNGAKNVPAGEAGMLVTNRDDVAKRARLFISHGENFLQARPRMLQDGDRENIGINGRLNEPTACIAYYGMKEVHANNARRRVLASELYRLLRHRAELQLLGPDEIYHHALYVYPFRLVDRTRLSRSTFLARLKKLGVEAGGGYITPPLHKYGPLPGARTPLRTVEELSEQSLVLLSQVRPPATKDDMRYVATCIEAALDGVIPPRLRKMGFISDSVF
jgi:perosamine synthetase